MNQINCLIVEDDLRSAEYMEDVLTGALPRLRLHLAHDLKEAEAQFAEHGPELLLLDINLPDGNSFELLEKLHQKDKTGFVVIFITAFADYAVQAFRHSALDYLLKPFAPAALTGAVSRALETLDKENHRLQLEAFFHNYRPEAVEKKLVLKTARSIHIIDTHKIHYAKAEDNYTTFYVAGDEKILVSQPLKSYEEQLDALGFIRVHQSWLVNLRHVKSYLKKEAVVLLSNGARIPVSQGKKPQLMARILKL